VNRGRLSCAFGWTAWVALAVMAPVLGLVSDSVAPPRRPVVAYVGHWTAQTDPAYAQFLLAFRARQPALAAQVRFEYVTGSDNDDEALTEAVRAAMARKPDVLVAPTGSSAIAARRVGGDTHVLFSCYIDPLRAGLVNSMSHPGGRMTGISLADTLDGKRLEILRDASPTVHTVAVLADSSWSTHYDGEARIMAEAKRHGLVATMVYAQTEAEIDALMSRPDAARFDAWYVIPTYAAYLAEDKIVGHIRRMGKYGMFATVTEVRKGGLLGYAQDSSFVWPTLADLIARVLAGEDPGTIPVERPKRFVLAVRTGPDTAATPVSTALVKRADIVF
jgi:putative tryptophan/tyrosine transport system substrate-binding protein